MSKGTLAHCLERNNLYIKIVDETLPRATHAPKLTKLLLALRGLATRATHCKQTDKMYGRVLRELRLVNTLKRFSHIVNRLMEKSSDPVIDKIFPCGDGVSFVEVSLFRNQGGLTTLHIKGAYLDFDDTPGDYERRFKRSITRGFSTSDLADGFVPFSLQDIAFGVLTRGGLASEFLEDK